MGDSSKLTERQQVVHNYILAATSLYGAVTPKQFLLLFNRFNEKKLLKDELMKYSYKLNHKFCCKGYYIYNNYIVNTEISEEQMGKIISCQNGKKYYNPSKDEFEAYINGRYYERTQFTDSFEKFILKKSSPLTDVNLIVSTIIFMIKSETRNQEIFNFLERSNITLDSEKEVNEFIQILMNLQNNTRKWANCGFSPNEMRAGI